MQIEFKVTALKLPSLRRALIRLHNDLFDIDDHVSGWISSEPLTKAEKMVLVLEDHRFFDHWGVSVVACLRELGRAVLGQPHGGASTIDMQFVRTATDYRELTLRRKLYEILLALVMQFRCSKREIFRSYLSCAFFGSGLYGIELASKNHFCKESSMLDLEEAAVIAAMLVYPKPLVPTDRWLMKVNRRARYGVGRFPRFEKRFKKIPGFEEL